MPREADPRKDVLLSSCAAFFGIPASDGAIAQLHDSKELNTFLDDGNCSLLAASLSSHGGDKKVQMSNKVSVLIWESFLTQIQQICENLNILKKNC